MAEEINKQLIDYMLNEFGKKLDDISNTMHDIATAQIDDRGKLTLYESRITDLEEKVKWQSWKILMYIGIGSIIGGGGIAFIKSLIL